MSPKTSFKPKPTWLKTKIPGGSNYNFVRRLKEKKRLHTVCEEARCPNVDECWQRRTATFMILGDRCTRNCRFCSVKTLGKRGSHDPGEPARVAEAVADMELKHAVITSVSRDDLEDGGAAMFAAVIKAIKQKCHQCSVEVLIPDFQGKMEALALVVEAGPKILGHNVETIRRLYPRVRPRADYERSLRLLQRTKQIDPGQITKSGIMVGLGERGQEVESLMIDLRQVECDIFTVGQYLCPSEANLPVEKYYQPAWFHQIRDFGLKLGFKWVEAGPLIRSSYRADAQAGKL